MYILVMTSHIFIAEMQPILWVSLLKFSVLLVRFSSW